MDGAEYREYREEGESRYLQNFKAPDYCCYCLLFVVVIRTKNRQHTHVHIEWHVERRQRFGHNGVTAGQSADAGGEGGGGRGGLGMKREMGERKKRKVN